MFRWRPRRHILGGRIWPVGSRALGERCRLASSAGSSLALPARSSAPVRGATGGQGGRRGKCRAGFMGVRPHLQRDCMKVIDSDLPSGLPRFPQ
jgi:hypothetical protein